MTLFLIIAIVAILAIVVLALRRPSARITTIETRRERKDDDA